MRLAFWYVLAMFHFPLFDNLELSKLFLLAKSMLNIKAFWDMYMGVEPKIGGFYPPKMDGENFMENPMNKWMILGGGPPLFLETPIYIYIYVFTYIIQIKIRLMGFQIPFKMFFFVESIIYSIINLKLKPIRSGRFSWTCLGRLSRFKNKLSSFIKTFQDQ